VLLAQLNIARMLAPITSPAMADFVARIEEVNARSDVAPGFVWRLRSDSGYGAVDQRIFDDDTLLVNMSVWTDSQSLFDFVYRDESHRQTFARRREWFAVVSEPMVVCWWVAETRMPTVADAQRRLETLRERGPSVEAFPFRRVIAPEFRPTYSAGAGSS